MKIAGFSALSIIVSALFCLCGLIRLAYYNVLEEQKQSGLLEADNSFLGLPITSSALILPSVYLVYDGFLISDDFIFIEILVVMGVLYITPFKIEKPGFIGKVVILIFGLVEFMQMLFASGAFDL